MDTYTIKNLMESRRALGVKIGQARKLNQKKVLASLIEQYMNLSLAIESLENVQAYVAIV